jgi:hypothetical protein
MWGGRCRVHFVLECKTLEENRKTQMVKLGEALEEAIWRWQIIFLELLPNSTDE